MRAGHLRHYVRNTTEGNPRPQYDKNASKSSQRKDDQKINSSWGSFNQFTLYLEDPEEEGLQSLSMILTSKG